MELSCRCDDGDVGEGAYGGGGTSGTVLDP